MDSFLDRSRPMSADPVELEALLDENGHPVTLFGHPVLVNPAMPTDEIRLMSSINVVRITGLES